MLISYVNNIEFDYEEIQNKIEQHIKYNQVICIDDFLQGYFNNKEYSDKDIKIIIEMIKGVIVNRNTDVKRMDVVGFNKSKTYMYKPEVEIKVIRSCMDLLGYIFSITMSETVKSENIIAQRKYSPSQMNKKSVLDITYPKITKETEKLFYRGHSSANFELIPSIFREEAWEQNESALYHNLITRCPSQFKDKKRHLDILQEMQHYSLPTRLLDVTQSPLVALFFATVDSLKYDGELVLFNSGDDTPKNSASDTVELLCSLAALPEELQKKIYNDAVKYKGDFFGDSEKTIKEFSEKKSVKQLLHVIRLAVGNFESIINPKDLHGIQFVVPRQENDRIVRQNGSFIICGLFGYEDNRKSLLINEYNTYRHKENSKIIRFVIPSECKDGILYQLKSLGINKSTIYPEIDNVANYLKENSKYTHRKTI